MPRYCNEPLTDVEGGKVTMVARCRRRYGTEHSHHDLTARQAVDAGVATIGECVTLGHHSRDVHKSLCLASFEAGVNPTEFLMGWRADD